MLERPAAAARLTLVVCLLVIAWPRHPALAQTDVEGSAGWAGFVDNSVAHHPDFGGAARFYLTPRLAVGPEALYMRGRGPHSDFILTGNLTYDLRPPRSGQRIATPYLVVGGGLFQSRSSFPTGTFVSTEGAFTAGGGVRVFLTDRLYVAPEARIGWELHLRASAVIGFRF